MLGITIGQKPVTGNDRLGVVLVLFGLLLTPSTMRGQTWMWKSETVDTSGLFTSIIIDSKRNIHISYVSEQNGGQIKYGFRPAASSRWFTMTLDNPGSLGASTKITLDAQGNPHLCYSPGVIKYASFDGRKWHIQQIAPGTGVNLEYTCAVAIGPDGAPHVSWYHVYNPDGSNFLHLKYAVLRDGAWMARTIDFDLETGKWHSMVLDRDGNPHIAYTAFASGQLKYAYWDGKKWNVKTVESRSLNNKEGAYSRGMGNSLLLNRDGKAQVSYEDDDSLRYARPVENSWAVETIDQIKVSGDWEGYRTHQVLDRRGFPHICYEDAGAVKHAYWDGSEWHIQVVSSGGGRPNRYSDMVIDDEGTLYVSYRDPVDGSLKLATGRLAAPAQTAAAGKKEKN